MTRSTRGVWGLRAVAIAIAVLGVVDPVVTMSGHTNATIAVVWEARGGPADPVTGLAERVIATLAPLASMFTVVRGPFAHADAVVAVGRDVPDNAAAGITPAFVVTPDQTMSRVDIEGIDAPVRAAVEGRVTVTVHVHGVGAAGRTDRVVLRSGGVAIDRVTHAWTGADARADVALRFLPSATGMTPLSVSVEAGAGGAVVAAADLAVDVESRRWAVLAYDARPSWASTFVRRAIEDDRRFSVVTRTVTSRGLSIDTGQSVPGLGDASRLAAFDAILVGAPDALTARDVDSLEAFARERGGTVVLLLDRAEPGAAARLIGIDRFTTRQGSASVPIAGVNGAGTWLASELALPDSLPAGSDVLASATLATAPRTPGTPGPTRAIVWQSPKGAGRMVVTGALDAWRYRADPHSAFASFWQATMAAAAAAAPPVIDVRTSESVVAAGEAIDVEVTRRETGPGAQGGTGGPGVTMRAWIERADGTRVDVARLWPDAMPGRFRGHVQMPSSAGVYRIVAADASLETRAGEPSGAIRGQAGVVVAPAVLRPVPDRSAVAAAWARARGGSQVPAARLGDLPGAVLAALHQQPQPERVHPMRSAWWIAPFALALGVEWWSRRRRGLA